MKQAEKSSVSHARQHDSSFAIFSAYEHVDDHQRCARSVTDRSSPWMDGLAVRFARLGAADRALFADHACGSRQS
jgi:hypothetical protein